MDIMKTCIFSRCLAWNISVIWVRFFYLCSKWHTTYYLIFTIHLSRSLISVLIPLSLFMFFHFSMIGWPFSTLVLLLFILCISKSTIRADFLLTIAIRVRCDLTGLLFRPVHCEGGHLGGHFLHHL